MREGSEKEEEDDDSGDGALVMLGTPPHCQSPRPPKLPPS